MADLKTKPECCLPHLPENDKKFNRSKAKIQTYLASKTPIVTSLGLAAQKGYWDFKKKTAFPKLSNFFMIFLNNDLFITK